MSSVLSPGAPLSISDRAIDQGPMTDLPSDLPVNDPASASYRPNSSVDFRSHLRGKSAWRAGLLRDYHVSPVAGAGMRPSAPLASAPHCTAGAATVRMTSATQVGA